MDLAETIGISASETATLRDDWYRYVSSSKARRTPDSWQRWWRAAGVALPSETSKPSLHSYVFGWNPIESPSPALNRSIEEVQTKGSSVFPWNLGNQRDIRRGARIVLTRQGSEPYGLLGVGEVSSDVQGSSKSNGKETDVGGDEISADVRWLALSREPFLDLPRLIQATGSEDWSRSSLTGIELTPAVSQKLEEIWPRAWAEHLQSIRAMPGVEARRWIARFDADRGPKDDRLSVKRYIQSFARVMASRNLTPPLSVGLFGDWGSGKTFFMDQQYAEIETLKEDHSDPPVYWNRICQIRFNAWHYTETNLWASVVNTNLANCAPFWMVPTKTRTNSTSCLSDWRWLARSAKRRKRI
jgi:hypothetical protein